jgi:hypothetical protein
LPAMLLLLLLLLRQAHVTVLLAMGMVWAV